VTEPEQGHEPIEVVSTHSATGVSWGLAFTLLAAVVVVVFAVQNTDVVPISFLAWTWSFPLAVVLLVVVVVSVVLDEIFGVLMRRRRRIRRQEREELRKYRQGE
jgi:uncharacterized integral membrane protein